MSKMTISSAVQDTVDKGARLMTDQSAAYQAVGKLYRSHDRVNHTELEFVRKGNRKIHTNSIENFWSLFDRIVHGTYIKPEPQHLLRYVDEQVFRFNERGGTDLTRFIKCIMQVSGKRLTYDELITSHLKYMM